MTAADDMGSQDDGPQSVSDAISRNVEAIAALEEREASQQAPFQRRLERLSRLISRPVYLVSVTVGVALWMACNSIAPRLGMSAFDPPPFQILEFVLSFVALLTTTIVLIGQNRQSRLEQYRSHLNLQVSFLTEQKVTKLIHLMEELRHDTPGVQSRHDAQAQALQEAANAGNLISALENKGLTKEEPGSGVSPQARPTTRQ